MNQIEIAWGSLEMVPVYEREVSKIKMGHYTIHRDRTGKETKRTDIDWTVCVDCCSEKEAIRLMAHRS